MLYVGHRGLMVDVLISGDFVDLCGSALDRVCMALYGPQVRCVGSGGRPVGSGGLSQAVKAMGGSDTCPWCHCGFDT
ncbi:hypothetical protein F2Q70_00030558 [Brassica cretica]|uniref:Uncharacterized protein n=1 Tax=Brassica cretica TaxID=69181 RepID=A0A8S9FFJ7_BRACR|nr:hypothetical protein F2Q70_00030558 [Brassica cretica]